MRRRSRSSGARDAARLLGTVRATLGMGLVVAPGVSMRVWAGQDGASHAARMAARSLGAREIALGFGTVAAADGESLGPWLRAGVLVDTADALATLAAFGRLPRRRRVAVLAAAGGSAVLGARLLRAL